MASSRRTSTSWAHFSLSKQNVHPGSAPIRSVAPATSTSPAAAPAALWTVSVERVGGNAPAGPLLAYIQRDEDHGFSRAGSRQSYFDPPGYQRFDDMGRLRDFDEPDDVPRRFGSINGLATGPETTVVAGYRGSARFRYQTDRGVPVDYSAAGPNDRSRPSEQVRAAALTDPGPHTPGVIAAGTRSGSLAQAVGTSTAAPQVARQMALAFAHGRRPADATNTADYDHLLWGVPVGGAAMTGTSDLRIRLGRVFVTTEREGGAG